jgi:glycosyltransferase involved in cell wall biosynthesis
VKIATLSNAAVIHTRRWVEHFRARGHDVRLWSLEPGPRELDVQPLPAVPLPDFVRYPFALGALARGLERFAPDLIDAHYVPNYGLLGALTRRRPLAVVAWGSDLLLSASRDPLRRARTRFVLERADAVIADSENLAAAARAAGASRSRVHAIPWGVNRERFHPRDPRDPDLLLSVRMHEPIYDIETLIEGVRPVLERRASVMLVIAGDGSRRSSLEDLAARCLPAGRYRFVGAQSVDAMADWLGRAAIVLSASRSDSTSMSLLEAMASGAIPVVSDIEGNREWVGEGEGARLFRPGDAGGVTRAVERVLDDASWVEEARERNRRVIAERADWSLNMRRIETLYENLARSAGARDRSGFVDPAARAREREH